jgi:GrpB-like predicted nucleotidyltransferase (UPF0157 family)
MLTPNQEGYLNSIPEDKIAHIVPFDPATQTTAKEIIAEVNSTAPLAKIFYIGSSKLGIAGENDIDITVLGENNFDKYLKAFEQRYGEPVHKNIETKYVKWEFIRNGFPVELHLEDFMKAGLQEQIHTQEILENDPDLRMQYEQMKLEANGLSRREYLRRKYEFWNKIQ